MHLFWSFSNSLFFVLCVSNPHSESERLSLSLCPGGGGRLFTCLNRPTPKKKPASFNYKSLSNDSVQLYFYTLHPPRVTSSSSRIS